MAKRKLMQLSLLFILPFLLCSCATLGIEKAKYEVIDKNGKFEVRQYKSQIVAETVVDSSFDEAYNIAFRRLFKYISGNNTISAWRKLEANSLKKNRVRLCWCG